jgi:MoaA/NifB/PqqE/SkfB family radical SAM enzyme
VNRNDVIRAWGHILAGYKPFLSIEVTRECPLRCPGCYAYDEQHLGGGRTLRDLADFRGDELVRRIGEVIDELRPMHVSIVGGDPLVRYREMDQVVPLLVERGIHVQFVTSAFRPIPAHWAALPRLNLTVSVDGLQPEHDARRAPATYDRVLKNIAGHQCSIHFTVTSQALRRPTYLQEFLEFWAPRPEAKRVWFSIFTPQAGDTAEENLSPEQRQFMVAELLRLRPLYPKLDMAERIIREYAQPPESPAACIFAKTTATVSADLQTRITPCQFGGTPDCARCGCIASMGLASLGHTPLLPKLVSVGDVLHASVAVGEQVNRVKAWYRAAQCRFRSTPSPSCSPSSPRPSWKWRAGFSGE